MTRPSRLSPDNVYTVVGSKGAELLKLEHPYPSNPHRPTKFFIYVNKNGRNLGVGFSAIYAAKKYLDLLIGDDTISKIKGITGEEDSLITSSGILIRAHRIDNILNYEYTKNEASWSLGEPDYSSVIRFRSRATAIEESPQVVEVKLKDKPRLVEAPKPDKVSKPSKEGLTTIAQIAESLKMESREARSILRSQKIKKPEVGWAWGNNEVDNIKKILQNNRE